MRQTPKHTGIKLRRTISRLQQTSAVRSVSTWTGRRLFWAQRHRIATGVTAALLIMASIILPVAQNVIAANRYYISHDKQYLLDGVNKKLEDKLDYDAEKQVFHFNQSGNTQADGKNPLQQMQKTAVGGSGAKLYSVDIPRDLSKGITYYDNQQDLQFTMTPEFGSYSGEKQEGRLVYPLKDVSGQAVYTIKNNGLKEDILLDKAPKDGHLSMRFKLNLPKTLEARVDPETHEVGIYSADPTLFGNISYGSDADRQSVMRARENSPKNFRVFVIPAPVIKETNKDSGQIGAAYSIEGDTLSLDVSNLQDGNYPLTIDPSVVITSASDFTNGNNESNIDISPDQINRGGLTGGTITPWTTTGSGFTTARYFQGQAVYNGYVYIGGGLGASALSDIQYAKINSDGTLGTWTATTSIPGANAARYGAGMVAYNGKMYIMGGYTGSTYLSDVLYTTINSDGTLGTTWTTSSVVLPSTRYAFGLVAYNNRFYIAGGYNGALKNDSYYATINADGSISSWTAGASFTNARLGLSMVQYNGYLYVAGGFNNTTTYYNDVQYAKINSDGTYSTWATTTSFATARYSMGFVALNGFMYLAGGNASAGLQSDTQYAKINANGTLGPWTAIASLSGTNATRYGNTMFGYNNFLYSLGGNHSTPLLSEVQYAPIDTPGSTGQWATSSPTITALPAARLYAAVVAYNGFVYVMGGQSGSGTGTAVATIYRAAIASDGGIGSWTTNTTPLPVSRTGLAAVAYNNKMYIMGGSDGAASPTYFNTTYYADIAFGDGSIGAWTASTNFGSGNTRAFLGAVAYGTYSTAGSSGYLYAIGGSNGSAAANHYSTVYKSTLSQSGIPGAWATTVAISGANAARDAFGVTIYGDKIYIAGGNTGSAQLNDLKYATITSSTGAISAWTTSANAFTSVRDKLSLAASNGYLYIMGGINSATYKNDIQYARITSSGDIGTWSTQRYSFTTARAGLVGFSYNGFLYIGAGYAGGTPFTDMQAAPINNGGAGGVGSWSTVSAALSANRYNHGTVAYNGFIYVIGGWNGSSANYYTTSAQGAVSYAQVGATGTLSAWTSAPVASNLTSEREDFGIAAYNGYLYIAGGDGNTSDLRTVQSIPINSDGSITSGWTNVAAGLLPDTDGYQGCRATIYNGYLYVAGGASTTYKNKVYYTALNANGTTGGSWSSSTFNEGRYQLGIAAYNGYFYVMGGTDDTTLMADVQYAPINANGSLGTFKYTASLNNPRKDFGVTVQNGYMYVVGGYDSMRGNTLIDVQVSAINSDGSLADWTSTTPFGTLASFNSLGRYGAGAVIANGYMFVTAGANDTTNFGSTLVAPVNTMSRASTYSQLIDLGAAVALPTSVTYNGTATITGSTTVSYQLAGSSGTFGTLTTAGSITPPSCTLSTTNTRYIWIKVTMDDSLAAAFAEATTNNAANVTDITFNYNYGRAPTNLRMHGGKYFAGNTQTPLDTCGL